jgi:hypothetical protein
VNTAVLNVQRRKGQRVEREHWRISAKILQKRFFL